MVVARANLPSATDDLVSNQASQTLAGLTKYQFNGNERSIALLMQLGEFSDEKFALQMSIHPQTHLEQVQEQRSNV